VCCSAPRRCLTPGGAVPRQCVVVVGCDGACAAKAGCSDAQHECDCVCWGDVQRCCVGVVSCGGVCAATPFAFPVTCNRRSAGSGVGGAGVQCHAWHVLSACLVAGGVPHWLPWRPCLGGAASVCPSLLMSSIPRRRLHLHLIVHHATSWILRSRAILGQGAWSRRHHHLMVVNLACWLMYANRRATGPSASSSKSRSCNTHARA
jgi:hypothetical protein